MFCVRNSCNQDLPVSIGSYTHHYEKSFVDVVDSVSHFEVRCIDVEIGNVGVDGPFHKLHYLHIEFPNHFETYDAEIWLTPKWEITFSTFQVDTPCRYDSMIAFTSAFSVREYRSKTFVSNGISRNCGFWRLRSPNRVLRDLDR